MKQKTTAQRDNPQRKAGVRMRKLYNKPMIFYESFVPSMTISSCSLRALIGEGNCGGLDPETGWAYFNTPMTGCDVDPLTPEGICYHNSSDSYTVFGS